MNFLVVTYHLPHPNGTATGRQVFGVWDGIRSLGHNVRAWAWGAAPAGLEPPEWVELRPFHDPGGWRGKPVTLRRPRWGLAGAGWRLPSDVIGWAEEPESYAVIAAMPQRGLTVPHSAWLDALALRRITPAAVQSARAERYAARRASWCVAFSDRVARAVGAAHVVAVAQSVPAAAMPPVEEPVALLIADWSWRPNEVARQRLLRWWPQVRNRLPEARLLLAGRGPGIRTDVPGVQQLGVVDDPVDVMSRAAVLAFPVPHTSGTKMKVLDAMAHGLPVVTTAGGAEGVLADRSALAVARDDEFVEVLVDVLSDPARRHRMATAARLAVQDKHAPEWAATQRLALL